MMVENQEVTDRYAVYHGDTVDVAAGMPARSVDLVVTSIPFGSLFVYSNSPRDFGNVKSDAQFFEQFSYLISQQLRVMKPGRLICVHLMNLPTSKERDGYIGLKDFRGDVIRAYQSHGFIFHSEICVWKCPVNAVVRTKALGLLHKQLKKDSAMSRQGIADFIVVFRTPGENAERIEHTNESFPVERWQRYASPCWVTLEDADEEGFLRCTDREVHGDESSGIDAANTLQATSARDHEDERHIAPLQLEVIARCIRLWSNPGDLVWDPFTGIGSTGVVALREKRRFIGAELKASYFNQAVANLREASDDRQQDLFASMEGA